MNQPSPFPPKLALALLKWFCRDALFEEISGDLYEEYQHNAQDRSQFLAKAVYWWQVLSFFRPFASKRLFHLIPTTNMMIVHYTKVAWRSMLRQGAFSLINLSGLAVGLAVALLIALWVHEELSFNTYHAHYDRLVQVLTHAQYEGEWGTNNVHTAGLGLALGSEYDAIFEAVARVRRPSEQVLGYKELKFTETGQFVEAALPGMLSLQMVFGSYEGLEDKYTLLISESLSQKFFGDANPTGKALSFNGSDGFTIAGVYQDLPTNSRFHGTKFMLSLELLFSFMDTEQDDWSNYFLETYALLHAGISADEASEAIADVYHGHRSEEEIARQQPETFCLPMTDWHLKGKFENKVQVASPAQRYVWFYTLTGIFVLLLACINFMNLSTARSERRAKEVGVRKAIGSVRRQLISQFMGEAALMTFLAMVLAVVLVLVVLPSFNQLSAKDIQFPWANSAFWRAAVGIALLTTLLAGSFPAFFLSGFQPAKVLKGTFKSAKSVAWGRRGLVIVQFAVSMALFVATLVVYQQVQYARNRPAGYDQDGLVVMEVRVGEQIRGFDAIRNAWIQSGAVTDVGRSSYSITDTRGWNSSFDWEGRPVGYNPAFNTITVDPEFGTTIGWQVLQGRDFDPQRETDKQGLVINQAAADLLGLENPVGESITWSPDFFDVPRTYTILGVVGDLIKGSPYDETLPTIHFLEFDFLSWINIRLNTTMPLQECLTLMEREFKKHVSSIPFEVTFASDIYARKFEEERSIGTMAGVFSGLTLFISCLGLFGLAAYSAQRRTKELGIRKVLGASVWSLWGSMSKEFVMLVLVSGVIGLPLAAWGLNQWLRQYAYHGGIDWWVWIVAPLAALVIAMATVTSQSLRAARINPVTSLRSE